MFSNGLFYHHCNKLHVSTPNLRTRLWSKMLWCTIFRGQSVNVPRFSQGCENITIRTFEKVGNRFRSSQEQVETLTKLAQKLVHTYILDQSQVGVINPKLLGCWGISKYPKWLQSTAPYPFLSPSRNVSSTLRPSVPRWQPRRSWWSWRVSRSPTYSSSRSRWTRPGNRKWRWWSWHSHQATLGESWKRVVIQNLEV